MEGVEPTNPYGHPDLNRARLPFRHMRAGPLGFEPRCLPGQSRAGLPFPQRPLVPECMSRRFLLGVFPAVDVRLAPASRALLRSRESNPATPFHLTSRQNPPERVSVRVRQVVRRPPGSWGAGRSVEDLPVDPDPVQHGRTPPFWADVRGGRRYYDPQGSACTDRATRGWTGVRSLPAQQVRVLLVSHPSG
jgi:hypothetical protein